MKKVKIITGLAWFCVLALISIGCGYRGGSAKAVRITEILGADGKVVSRTTETDKNRMTASGIAAKEVYNNFSYSRSNHLGGVSSVGLEKLESDPDQDFAAALGGMFLRQLLQGGAIRQLAPVSPVTPVAQPAPPAPPTAKEDKPETEPEE